MTEDDKRAYLLENGWGADGYYGLPQIGEGREAEIYAEVIKDEAKWIQKLRTIRLTHTGVDRLVRQLTR